MNRDKQIEEMAKDLENYTCMSEYQAEIASRMLYIKGYRKASDVVREVIDHIDGWFMYCEKYSGDVIKLRLAELKNKHLGEDINVSTKESEFT